MYSILPLIDWIMLQWECGSWQIRLEKLQLKFSMLIIFLGWTLLTLITCKSLNLLQWKSITPKKISTSNIRWCIIKLEVPEPKIFVHIESSTLLFTRSLSKTRQNLILRLWRCSAKRFNSDMVGGFAWKCEWGSRNMWRKFPQIWQVLELLKSSHQR